MLLDGTVVDQVMIKFRPLAIFGRTYLTSNDSRALYAALVANTTSSRNLANPAFKKVEKGNRPGVVQTARIWLTKVYFVSYMLNGKIDSQKALSLISFLY